MRHQGHGHSLILLVLCALSLDGLYQSGDFTEVVRQSPAALAAAATRADSAEIARLTAFSLVALGRGEEAAGQFRLLLRLAPGSQLDPETVSPKIRQVFERVRLESAARQDTAPAPRIDTLILRSKPSPAALLPGIEQLKTRELGKGYALLAAGLATVGGSVLTHVRYNEAHRYYLQQTELGEIEKSYRVSNNWYKARTVCISSAGLVWLYSLLDAVFF